MKVSIVIPVLNEEENIPLLFSEIDQVFISDLPEWSYDIVFVDDGSEDKSWSLISKIHQKQNHVKGIQLSRNFGQHVAILAGLQVAQGDLYVIMDADLQDSPSNIPRLIAKHQEGNDLVYAVRNTYNTNWIKRFTSSIFWKLIRSLSGLNIPMNQSMLRIFNNNVKEAILSMPDQTPFLAGMFSWVGFKTDEVSVEGSNRNAGNTKYSFSKMIQLSLNAIIGYSDKPLYIISITGIAISICAIIYALVIAIRKIWFEIALDGWASLAVLISFLSGIILFSLGLIAIYIGRLYRQSVARPLYIVANELGIANKKDQELK